MIQIALLVVLGSTISMNVSAVDQGDTKTPSLNLLPLACNIAHNSNLDNRVKCLTNAKVLIRKNINNNYKKLGIRDRTHLLNTKALELKLQSNSCASLVASKVVKMECEIQSDLSLLSYMELRYEI